MFTATVTVFSTPAGTVVYLVAPKEPLTVCNREVKKNQTRNRQFVTWFRRISCSLYRLRETSGEPRPQSSEVSPKKKTQIAGIRNFTPSFSPSQDTRLPHPLLTRLLTVVQASPCFALSSWRESRAQLKRNQQLVWPFLPAFESVLTTTWGVVELQLYQCVLK